MPIYKNNQLDLKQLSDKKNHARFTEEIIVLHEFLSSDANFSKHGISVNSNLLDLANYYDSMNNLQNEYAKRKNIAPNWKTALKQWIEEIEDDHLGNVIVQNTNGAYVTSVTQEVRNPLMVRAYNDITSGKNESLYNYAEYLVIYLVEVDRLMQLATGTALAYMLPKLKQELNEYEQENGSIQTNNLKFNWTGTPGEFGAWIDLCMELGYIENIPTKKHKVNTSLSGFSIKNQTGQPVSVPYLTDCFGRNKHHFNPKELKVPFSINYGKDK